MSLDEAIGQGHHRRATGSGAERLQQTGAVLQLVLQGEVAEQGFGEGLTLLQRRLRHRSEASGRRGDDVGDAALLAKDAGDGGHAEPGVVGVLGQFALDGLGAGLRPSGLGDLDLGLGEPEQGAELGDDHGLRGSHQEPFIGVGVLLVGNRRTADPCASTP